MEAKTYVEIQFSGDLDIGSHSAIKQELELAAGFTHFPVVFQRKLVSGHMSEGSSFGAVMGSRGLDIAYLGKPKIISRYSVHPPCQAKQGRIT